jgi:TRAP-type C4-dicarboxylate transport system permease small subunit
MLLAYCAYVSVRSLSDYEYWTIFAGITLGVHEAGHIVFAPFGELLGVAGGSIMQLAAPVIVALLFLRQREYFGITVAFAWLSMSLSNLATYIGDARAQDLPLVSIGNGDPIHDWHYMLGHFGMLAQDHALARFARLLSVLALLFAMAWGAWLLNSMRLSAGTPPPADEELVRG